MSHHFPGQRFAYRVRTIGAGAAVVAILLAGSAASLGDTVWCSEFETDGGAAVSHEQVAEVVDNSAGTDGTALGAAPGLNPLIYVQYGQSGVPAIPSIIDPTGAAVSFNISTPDDRTTGINTNVPSNTGNAGASVTFEGYFFALESEAIVSLNLKSADVLGPNPCPLARLRSRYRHELIIRTANASVMRQLLAHLQEGKLLRTKAQSMAIDVDPVALA